MQTVSPNHNDSRPEPLAVLLDASALLLATGGSDGVLTQILDLANRLVAADAYAVWHTEGDGGYWRMISGRGLTSDFLTEF